MLHLLLIMKAEEGPSPFKDLIGWATALWSVAHSAFGPY